MNRELKFRIWDKKNKIFIYEWDASHKRLAISLVGLVYHGGYDDVLPENDYVVQQWTGLKDLKGIEIYEGDIVKSYNTDTNTGEDISSIFKVYFDQSFCQFRLKHRINSYTMSSVEIDCEIIGNIFETPELLK